MRWAMPALAWQLLEWGITSNETFGEFEHSNIFIVDDHDVVVGSSNWDASVFDSF
jgi:phosphatidylserine/phosphatidylglycerophosphate/cardiolipin synthase-like enzyme